MLTVDFIGRDGSKESARFFSESSANDFFDFTRGGGKFLGGAVESNGVRLSEFGILRDGVTIPEARKMLREAAKAC